ncbi:hypothetical protein CAEBREN_06832 [Caenorhabditis brenneri]|uniref:DUF19 domain-containing protein n=1 Tax=Caenorhabditis brenneri TaxID=135651 RepID=G0NNP3_CAEBE|nr:hypothetical protein CAEBREN_06832 [Caenorhabditis brenneri]
MRLLLILLPVIFFVLLNAAPAPTVEECLEEFQKAKHCACNTPNLIKLVPTEEFEEREQKIKEFHECLGPMKCEITKKAVAKDKKQIELLKLLGNLYDCLGSNGNYDNAKNSCRSWSDKGSCSYGAFITCIAEELAIKPECSSKDVEEFKNLKEEFEGVCQTNAKFRKTFSGYGRVQLN